MLHGGFPMSQVSLVYGEASTGKTTLAIQCAVESARRDLKVLYVDADKSFSQNRFAQLAGDELERIAANIVIFAPETFAEQTSIIEEMESYLTGTTGMIIVDTMTSLYRLSLGSTEKVFAQNRELNRQLAYLAELATVRGIAVLITSQVHGIPFRGDHEIEPVARRILTYWCGVIVKLVSTANSPVKTALLERHSQPGVPLTSCLLRITERGLKEA
jgi:DNA repair protein RadB